MERKIKKWIVAFAVVLVVFTGAVVHGAEASDLATFAKDPWGVRWSRAELVLDRAVEDIKEFYA